MKRVPKLDLKVFKLVVKLRTYNFLFQDILIFLGLYHRDESLILGYKTKMNKIIISYKNFVKKL